MPEKIKVWYVTQILEIQLLWILPSYSNYYIILKLINNSKIMIHVKENTLVEAWKKSFHDLYEKGAKSPQSEFYRFSHAVIEVADTASKDTYCNHFPMSLNDINTINEYLLTGKDEEKVIHDWTKIYRNRLFAEEYNQIENIIEYLIKKPNGKRAQASIWNQEVDLYGKIGPCLQVIWLQIIDNKLEMHTHMRATDCYGKLLMNMNEFIALQNYIANRLSVQSGSYVQFIDSLHFNMSDKNDIEMLIGKI